MKTELAGARWKEVVSPEDKVNDQWVKLSSVLITAMEQYIPKKSTLSHIYIEVSSSHSLTKKP